jgi:hypothetical protein
MDQMIHFPVCGHTISLHLETGARCALEDMPL